MVSRNLLAAFMEEETPQSSKRRAWDDEFVLKRQFSALIPAFDPRPGRTNINQVSNVSSLSQVIFANFEYCKYCYLKKCFF